MASRSGQNYHEFWGSFAQRSDLPNVLGAATQKAALQIGDYAWVTGELTAFRCIVATLGAAMWVAEPWMDSRRGVAPMIEDWVSLLPAGRLGWSAAVAGAGASSQINNALADVAHVGILELDTGTTATGVTTQYLGVDGLVTPASSGLAVCEATVRVQTLSTAAQRYIVRTLLGDSLVAADHTDGVYFEYNEGVSGNLWLCKTAASGVRTTTVTATAVVAAAWFRLRAVITAAQVQFFVNDQLVATHVANIPTTNAQRYAPNLQIQKTVGVGTSSLFVDYYQLRTVMDQVR